MAFRYSVEETRASNIPSGLLEGDKCESGMWTSFDKEEGNCSSLLLPPPLVLLSPQSWTTIHILLGKMLQHEILQLIETHHKILQRIETHHEIFQGIENVPTPKESGIPQSVMGDRFAGNTENIHVF